MAEERALIGNDPDVHTGDKESDRAVLVGESDPDVVEPTEVAKGDPTKAVDLVLADSVMGWRLSWIWFGFKPGVESG